MIREEDVREAIAECEGVRNPTSSTCIKLAAYYTILKHIHKDRDGVEDGGGYSFTSAVDIPFSGSRFSELVESKGIEKCFPIIDEAMDVLCVVNTKLYQNIMRRLDGV